jgi:phosphatidylinositol alpha-1,6-mannosyltransferase
LYQVADVFVLLSGDDDQSSEGWGTVFMEAAASGLPVVAGNVGGAPEAVLNEKTGLLVNPMNDDEVLAALVRLLKNPAEAKQLGAAAKARAQNEFTWRKQLEKFSRAV